MVLVSDKTATATIIDHYLQYLWAEWTAVTQVADEWDDLTDYEQLDFVIEWPIREDRLLMLRRWSDLGELSPEQAQRFGELQVVIEQNRPIIDRLLAD